MMRILQRKREADAQGIPLVVAPAASPIDHADLQSPQNPAPFKPVQRQPLKSAQKNLPIPEGFKRAENLSGINVTFNNKPLENNAPAGSEEAAEAEANFDIMKQFWDARMQFGLSRIKLGSYLHMVKSHRLWIGFADSWEGFLAKENVNSNAARQYMAVAKKFIFEMDLSQQVLAKLSLAGITALEKAATQMTKENQEEIVAILSELAERDAIQQLLELSHEDEPVKDKPNLRVLSLLRQFSELPPDMQLQFKEKILGNEKRRKASREADERAMHGN